MPEDGNRYEAIGGELYVTPPPQLRHQRIARNLMDLLLPILQHPGYGELLFAPVGVEVWTFVEGAAERLLAEERLDVRVNDAIVGHINLPAVFAKRV